MVLFATYRLLKNNSYVLFYYKNGNRPHIKFAKRFSTHNGEEVTMFSNGRKLNLSTGKYARLADGCAIANIGDTSVIATAVSKFEPSSMNTFLPLVVDYQQKSAAAGRIPTNFLRRDIGRAEGEILASRLLDRSVRPLFPEGYFYDTQIICSMLAVDGVNDPDVIAINAASAALSMSDIPWDGPVGAVRIGMIDNEIVINPSRKELQQSLLNLVVTAKTDNLVVMLEGSANEIADRYLMKCIRTAVKECQSIIKSISKLQKIHGKVKRTFTNPTEDKELLECMRLQAEADLRSIFSDYTHDKISRDKAVSEVRCNVLEFIQKIQPDIPVRKINTIFSQLTKSIFRSLIFENNKRCDGRKTNELRNITGEINLFKPLHGSALFQRGQTQVLCTVTLDSVDSSLKLDPISMIMSGIKEKNFFLHYEFPPFATNDVDYISKAVGRRELGHGALAEKGLRAVLPRDYPFTIRLTSEVLESNGSSSMATICGGSLALMDAGVPISSAVAGVAIGLISKQSECNTKYIEEYKILTDISGIEDYFGDMDFKIAGTTEGITALQADVKIPGLPLNIISESIHKAMQAQKQILQIMQKIIPSPREEYKDNMPVTDTIEIATHQRGKFLGAGGLNLKRILAETGVHIYPVEDSKYSIFAPNEAAMNEAKEMIDEIMKTVAEPSLEFGGIYKAKIEHIRDTGVMVTLYPSMRPTLLSLAQLDHRKVFHPSALGLEVGQEIQVKYFGRDPVSGQMRLSRKALLEPIETSRTLFSSSE